MLHLLEGFINRGQPFFEIDSLDFIFGSKGYRINGGVCVLLQIAVWTFPRAARDFVPASATGFHSLNPVWLLFFNVELYAGGDGVSFVAGVFTLIVVGA